MKANEMNSRQVDVLEALCSIYSSNYSTKTFNNMYRLCVTQAQDMNEIKAIKFGTVAMLAHGIGKQDVSRRFEAMSEQALSRVK